MVASVTPSTGTFNFFVAGNQELPTGLTLNHETGLISRSGIVPNDFYDYNVIVIGSGLASGFAVVRVTLTVESVNPVLITMTL